MSIVIGHVEAIFRYPVKSMRGEPLDEATLGWHGLAGDRRLALRRVEEHGGFPWLTASKLPELVLFTPRWGEGGNGDGVPAHVVAPTGEAMPVFGGELAAEIGRRHGAPVQMMHLQQGVFDDASVSVITTDTVREIGRLAGTAPDVRRFRPNVLVRSARATPFEEGEWLGGVLAFGETGDAPAVTVTHPDVRCVMVNLDPDDGSSAPAVLKSVARANRSEAGIYATVTRVGRLAVGQAVVLHR